MSRRHGLEVGYSPVTVVVCLSVVLALLLLYFWRMDEVPQHKQLPVVFEHFDHAAQQCVDCHHNFVDDTGGGACYNCHKMSEEINREMESMFHDFCRGCHIEKRLEDEDSGPLRECSGCHG